MNARKERILPPDEIEDLHYDDSDFLKSFEIKSKINIFFSQIHLILTVNNKNINKTKKKTNNSIKTIISVMTAKKKERKKGDGREATESPRGGDSTEAPADPRGDA